MSDARILVGDVGATHARFGLADGSGGIAGVRVYSTAEFSHGATLVDTYLDESSPEELVGACLAVAGPVIDGHAQLSNLDQGWSRPGREHGSR